MSIDDETIDSSVISVGERLKRIEEHEEYILQRMHKVQTTFDELMVQVKAIRLLGIGLLMCATMWIFATNTHFEFFQRIFGH